MTSTAENKNETSNAKDDLIRSLIRSALSALRDLESGYPWKELHVDVKTMVEQARDLGVELEDDGNDNSEAIRTELRAFTGNNVIYRHPTAQTIQYTEGLKRFADLCGAWWLVDILISEPAILKHAKEFAAITVTVKDSKADIAVHDGNENTVFTRHIEFTNCPKGKWDIFFMNNVLLLPTEN